MPHSDLKRWAARLPVLAIVLGAIVLKLNQWYHARPLWLDEEMVALNVRDRGFTELAGPLWLDQTAPLGWLALQKVAFLTFGAGDRVIRTLPVLFAIGMLACALWIGRRWLNAAGTAVFVLLCGFGQWSMFYGLEAKPYAADAFWGILLPALAAWAVAEDGDRNDARSRRLVIWWTAAIAGQWTSYGAVFVTPACVCVLLYAMWRRGGVNELRRAAVPALAWLVNFLLHYYLVMRHATNSDFLAEYWASGMRPPNATLIETLRWLGEQLAPLASHPGGSNLAALLWVAFAYGIVVSFRTRPALAVLWLAIPVSGAILALFSAVPWKDRLAFWMLPAFYGAIASAADDSVDRVRAWWVRNNLPSLAAAALAVLVVWSLCWNIVARGQDSARILRGRDNHGFDDRAGWQFLAGQRQPGDVLLATHFSLPAVWWYGDISIGDPSSGGYQPDRAPIFKLTHHLSRTRCRGLRAQEQLRRTLTPANRALVYLGFDSSIPPGFQQLILDELIRFSTLVDYRRIGSDGAAAIFDLRQIPAVDAVDGARMQWYGQRPGQAIEGCVGIAVAERW